MRILWNGGVEVYRIAARGVRLRGELRRDGRVSWGEIDKLLPPPSGKPFRLPDISVDLADTAIALKTPYGNLGFGLYGAGNLTGGFKGRLAVAGPKSGDRRVPARRIARQCRAWRDGAAADGARADRRCPVRCARAAGWR